VTRDSDHSGFEDRYRAIGATTTGLVLLVIFALDESGTIRRISARRPTRRERHDYEATP
jgi:uncharacterized DUF497 family protein